jgi:hypothetical protein
MVEKELEPICNFIATHGNAGTTAVLKLLCETVDRESEALDVPGREKFDCAAVNQMADELRVALTTVAVKCEFREAR